MNGHAPTLFDFLNEVGIGSSAPSRRKRGRPKLAPLPSGSGLLPTGAERSADELLSLPERREALKRWVILHTREPNRRDYSRAVLQMLADHADLDPTSTTYLECQSLKQRVIAEEVGVSERSVRGVMQRLRGRKIISSTRIGRTDTRYTLHAVPLSAVQ